MKWFMPAAVAITSLLVSCQDEVSGIGSSIANDEVTITVDSVETKLDAVSVYYDKFDGRNATKLLGRLRVPEYGNLDCSFVTQMLCASSMNIPDSIGEDRVDSIRLVLSVPRGALTGDSLAPQQLKVYRLDKQLPSDISSSFSPKDYYSASGLMGTRSYSLSNIAKGDSAVKNESYVRIPIMLPREFGLELFRKYRAGDPILQWPATFNQWFPGIYVEQNFGNGCVANITRAEVFTYWNRINRTYDQVDDDTYEYVDHVVRDSICLLASQPEVLSSNIIDYTVSDHIKDLVAQGKSVITTPGGYRVDMTFPIRKLVEGYLDAGDIMSVVSSLSLDIPASEISNDYGLTMAPYLLMVKKSERENFFNNNSLPDNKTSFYAAYNATTGSYQFASLRAYFLEVLEKVRNGEQIAPEDEEYSLVPVNVTLETVTGYSSVSVYVTNVQPYLFGPTMCSLDMDKAIISFVYSSQKID